LSNALVELQRSDWVVRNPGHGHPLRPEYILTATGETVAAWCANIMEKRRELGLEPQNLPRWSMPLVAQLASGWTRFSGLQEKLSPVSPRALSLTLKQMIMVDVIARRLENGFPPHSLYGLTGRGWRLASAIAA
jgi:DNA-binding HxlR family transcriptional regulator